MKKTNRFILGIAAAAAVGFIVYAFKRRRESAIRHARVAEEGYETAHDILFPDQKSYSRKLRFGPVLPE